MLEQATSCIRKELSQVDDVIARETTTDIAQADALAQSLVGCGGKRIRPAILLLAAKLAGGSDGGAPRPVSVAAAIELIHAASLMHDDVLDGSSRRRRRKSANSVFGDKFAILAGDLFWTTASQLILEVDKPQLLRAVIATVKDMTLGQMQELSCTHNVHMDEATCIAIAEAKTASLFRLAASAGSILAGAPPASQTALAEYGLYCGLSFQLMDDAMDYAASEETLGKQPGTDLEVGAPTLPFVHAMQKASPSEAEFLINALRGKEGADLQASLHIIETRGGIAYTLERSSNYARKAKQALSFFPASPFKTALMTIADFAARPYSPGPGICSHI